MNKDINIGNINFNTSCGCNSSVYPYGTILFGDRHKQSTDKITDITVVIANDSDEGRHLREMLDQKVEVEKIQDFIFMLIVKNKPLAEIRSIIQTNIDNAYNRGVLEGKRIKQKEVMDVLGF